MKQPKTTLGPIRSFTLKENISVQRLARSFATDKKKLTTLYNRIKLRLKLKN